MQAINHAATALILKKKFPAAPLFGLLVATEAVEFLWVALNLLGFEHTVIGGGTGDPSAIHLVHMPYSHSIATSAFFALVLGVIVAWRGWPKAGMIAVALSLALFSHIVLDLATHSPDIPLAPFAQGPKYGSGLYSDWPLVALLVESLWGVLCWRIYRGSWPLLALIVGLNALLLPTLLLEDASNAPLFTNGQEFALIVLGQMIITIGLLWAVARRTKVSALS